MSQLVGCTSDTIFYSVHINKIIMFMYVNGDKSYNIVSQWLVQHVIFVHTVVHGYTITML